MTSPSLCQSEQELSGVGIVGIKPLPHSATIGQLPAASCRRHFAEEDQSLESWFKIIEESHQEFCRVLMALSASWAFNTLQNSWWLSITAYNPVVQRHCLNQGSLLKDYYSLNQDDIKSDSTLYYLASLKQSWYHVKDSRPITGLY